jgi:hypothetical protein
VLSANMTLDKRQELERLRAAILQEQDTDILIKLLEELNEAVSYSKRRNAVVIASRQRGASVLKCKESQGLPKAGARTSTRFKNRKIYEAAYATKNDCSDPHGIVVSSILMGFRHG